MRTVFTLLVVAVTCGCQTSPGLRLAWEFNLPPTVRADQTLTPMPAMQSTAYAIDGASHIPVINRSVSALQGGGPAVPVPPSPPAREYIPMPRATTPGPAPCGSQGGGE